MIIFVKIDRKSLKIQILLDGGKKNENFNHQFYVFFNHSDRFSILKNICLDKNMTKIGLI